MSPQWLLVAVQESCKDACHLAVEINSCPLLRESEMSQHLCINCFFGMPMDKEMNRSDVTDIVSTIPHLNGLLRSVQGS